VPLRAADFLIPVDPSKVSSFSKYGNLLAAAPAFLLWLARHKDAPTNKTCMDFLAAVRRERRGVKVGMVGFCWGGRYALRAAREQNMIDVEGVRMPLVDAVVALHPSNLEFPEDVARPVVPVSIGWGLEDTGVKIEQKAKVEGIHDAERQTGRRMPELENRVYTPGRHGFAVRGNPDDALERKALEDSVTQVVDWFARFLV
jgi:dienelactone hydrolase